MKRLAPGSLAILFLVSLAGAQKPQPADEDEVLQRALADAGSSPVDFIRALERHLEKYPKTAHRPEIERSILKEAIESGDEARILDYGERVAAREGVELKVLERIIGVLLANGDKERAGRALDYARRYEESVRQFEKEEPKSGAKLAVWRDDVDRAYARAYLMQARALGVLGRNAEALEAARKAYAYPDSAGAREMARALVRLGRDEEAVASYAEAFVIPDPKAREADRASDRARMGELYRRRHASEAGLGDIVLEAYDRTAQAVKQRELKLRQLDPNARLTKIGEFTLSGLDGSKLPLDSLRGKVVVLDFWATWCGPCRLQHGLYEQVKQRFSARRDLAFVSVSTDDDRSAVPEFLKENGWDRSVYFEDGLSAALQIDSIPTTILLGRNGEIESRMNAFHPSTFVEQLSERIRRALGP